MQKLGGFEDDLFGQSQAVEKEPEKKTEFPKTDIHETFRLAGIEDAVLEDENEQRDGNGAANEKDREREKARAEARRRRRLLCCCGVRGCGIGPMTQVEEVDER